MISPQTIQALEQLLMKYETQGAHSMIDGGMKKHGMEEGSPGEESSESPDQEKQEMMKMGKMDHMDPMDRTDKMDPMDKMEGQGDKPTLEHLLHKMGRRPAPPAQEIHMGMVANKPAFGRK